MAKNYLYTFIPDDKHAGANCLPACVSQIEFSSKNPAFEDIARAIAKMLGIDYFHTLHAGAGHYMLKSDDYKIEYGMIYCSDSPIKQ